MKFVEVNANKISRMVAAYSRTASRAVTLGVASVGCTHYRPLNIGQPFFYMAFACCVNIYERTNERTVLIQEQSPHKRKDGDRRTHRETIYMVSVHTSST